MQFKNILLTLSVVTAAIAAPAFNTVNVPLRTYSVQDLQSVTDTFTAIQGAIDKMVEAVKGYNGDPAALAAIQTGSDDIKKIMDEGAVKIAASPAMGLMDAINILGPTGTLSSKVDDIVIALASKKEDFIKANLGDIVINDLKGQKDSSDQLVKAILANLPMPGLLGVIAGPIAGQITTKLDNAIKAWSS
jgi:hypothetical protein